MSQPGKTSNAASWPHSAPAAAAKSHKAAGPEASDDDGTGPFSVEVKRTSRYQLRRAWVDQARRQSKDDGRPWLLVIAEHGERKPVAVVDFAHFCMLARAAGLIPQETARDPLAGAGGSNEPATPDPPSPSNVTYLR